MMRSCVFLYSLHCCSHLQSEAIAIRLIQLFLIWNALIIKWSTTTARIHKKTHANQSKMKNSAMIVAAFIHIP